MISEDRNSVDWIITQLEDGYSHLNSDQVRFKTAEVLRYLLNRVQELKDQLAESASE